MSVKSNWSNASMSFTVSLFSFCFPDQYIEESGVLKSLTLIVLGAMHALNFSKVSFMKRVPLHLEHRWSEFRVLLGGFFPLTYKKCSSMSLLMTLGGKSILSDIRIATPACFLRSFACKIVFQPFTLR